MQNNGNDKKPEWQKIAETQSEHELAQGHKFWLWAYRIGVGGSFTALAIFIIERMSGTDAQIWDYTSGQALNSLVGLIFAFAFSAFVYGFYLTDYSIKQRLFVFTVAVIFPLFAEVSQTMNRGEESQKAGSQASPEFLAAQAAFATMTGANPAAGNAGAIAAAAGEKAKHEAELKACSRYTVATKREKCQRYEQGKIAEADGKAQGYTASSNAALTAHQGNLTNMIGTIQTLGNNANHAHSMVKLFMELGISLLVASLIMATLIIGSIETALAWLGDHVKNHQKAMRARGLEIGNQKKAVVKAYRSDSSPTPLNESAPMTALTNTANAAKQTVAEYATKIEEGLKASPEIIATEYARANAGNNRLMEDAGNIAGKLGAKLDDALNAANRKDYPQTILYPNAEGKSPEDYSIIKRVDKSPTLSGENTVKYLAPRMSVEETVKAIQSSVKVSGATSPEAIQAAVFDGFAALHNPAPLSDDVLNRMAGKLADKATLHAPHARVEAEHAENTQPVLHAPHARVGGLEVGSIEAYEAADSAKVGSSVGCPQCGTEFTKRNQQHRFCCKEHRFAWHNDQDPKRKEFMNSRSSKAA
jgi:hypothetical protein